MTGLPTGKPARATVWFAALAVCLGLAAVVAFWAGELLVFGLFGVPADRGSSPIVPPGSNLLALTPLLALVALASNANRGALAAAGLLAFALGSTYCALVVSSTEILWPAFFTQLALVGLSVALTAVSRYLWDCRGRRRKWAAAAAAGSAACLLVLGTLVQMPVWAFAVVAIVAAAVVAAMCAVALRKMAGSV